LATTYSLADVVNDESDAKPTPAAKLASSRPRGRADPRDAQSVRNILAFVEQSVVEDEVLLAARERAQELGATPVAAAVGAMLSISAQMVGAKAVVEVGTGAGVSGLWLLDGMRDDGVLTTIDSEPEHLRAARTAFATAAVAPTRTRVINGRALDVLGRLADACYDLVFLDTTPIDHPLYVDDAVRLLRPGGVILMHNALLDGRVADPAHRDPTTLAVRTAARAIAEDPRLTSVLLPLGPGILCACRN
jgi:predicted O-methyltransferase YrrM